jgi:hypothetical protein
MRKPLALYFVTQPEPLIIIIFYLLTSMVCVVVVYLVLGIMNPWIIRQFGKIWEGEATTSELANVSSLALVPIGLTLIYQIFLLLIGAKPALCNVNTSFQSLI